MTEAEMDRKLERDLARETAQRFHRETEEIVAKLQPPAKITHFYRPEDGHVYWLDGGEWWGAPTNDDGTLDDGAGMPISEFYFDYFGPDEEELEQWLKALPVQLASAPTSAPRFPSFELLPYSDRRWYTEDEAGS